MALSHSPRIITDGLVLCLDAGNYKSHLRYSSGWSGTYGSATNSFDGSTSTASGAVGGTFSATYTFPAPLITSSSTVRIFTDLGASSGQIGSTVNIILINGVDITEKLKNAGAYAGLAQWIDITTEVGGVFKTIQLNGTSGVSNPGIYAVEVGGQVLVDSVTWTDLSGQGNNGTLTNGPTYSSDNGGSIVFDGSSDRVVITSSDGFGEVSSTPTVSMEMWAKITRKSGGGQQFQQLAGFRNDTDFDFFFLLLDNSESTVNTEARIRTSGGVDDISVSYTSYFDEWTHIVYTANVNRTDLYLNGVLAGSNTGVTGSFGSSSGNFVIGSKGTGDFSTLGNISNVKFYNKPLTASEVSQNFNALRGRYGI